MTVQLHNLDSLQDKFGYNHRLSTDNRHNYSDDFVAIDNAIKDWRDNQSSQFLDDHNTLVNDMLERVYLNSNMCFEYLDQQDGYNTAYVHSLSLLKEIRDKVRIFKYALLSRYNCVTPLNTYEVPFSGAGICGNFGCLFIKLATRLHVKCRRVEFYTNNMSHVGVEVYYGGGWHYIDVTWSAFFKQHHTPPDALLSIMDIMQIDDVLSLLQVDGSSIEYQMYTASEDPFFYITGNTKIKLGEIGEEGQVKSGFSTC